MGKKVVIIGAGSTMFSQKMIGDLLWFDDLDLDTIALVDINEEKLGLIQRVAENLVKQTGRKTRIVATPNRREVLQDADFVINSISVGGVERYKRDLAIVDSYGVNQNLGDIIGPCGIFRMLREYPEILGMCRDMEELCPDAYFFNYSNPCAALTIALCDATPIKVFGICHNVQSTWIQLADYLQVDRKRLTYWCAGINHMDWFLELKIDGKDAYPKLWEIANDREKILEVSKYETYYSKDHDPDGTILIDYVRFEIMKKFGYFVSESPFHMSEYTPYFRKNDEMIREWCVDNRWWLKHELSTDKTFEAYKEKLDAGEDIPFEKSAEYVPEIIHALCTGKIFRANLNVSNKPGFITNLPGHAAVEIPCYIDAEGIHPCYIGELPEQLAALNRSNASEQILMAKAANEKKKQYIHQAVMMDPFVGAQCTLEQITNMMDELIASHEADGYLADFE